MRPWTAPVAGLVAFLLVSLVVAEAPAAVARGVKATYHAVPATRSGGALHGLAQAFDAWADEAARAFALGRPEQLAQLDVRLVASDPAPGQWHGSTTLNLAWTNLGGGLRYEVLAAPVGSGLSAAKLLTTVAGPSASADVGGDGEYTLWIRPVAHGAGRATAFGPFLVDASPPPAPVLQAPAAPPGYSFTVGWSSVTDRSGIGAYELQRRLAGAAWTTAATTGDTHVLEDQIGNGEYEYRVRALNGAGVPSPWSASAKVVVRAPMRSPGPGTMTYGVHANYTGFVHLWDLSSPSRYATINQVPSDVRSGYLGPEPAIETQNTTIQAIVAGVVGTRTNTLDIAEQLFIYLFNHADYDSAAAADPNHGFQRAGLTLDRGKGICGDLAVLYITLLRIAGVPARPVHGYLDNALSGIGGFHMWVEVWVGPANADRPWMTVDVSGVTGTYRPEDLFPYFGVFNPDYLALGDERNYHRYADGQWNTWARFRYTYSGAQPHVDDGSQVTDYDSEYGRLFFDTNTMKTLYVPCQHYAGNPEDPCPNEPAPAGYTRFYGMKGVSKKRIDFGARLTTALPSCLKVEVRYPEADTYGAVVPDQSAIYRVYTTSTSSSVQVGQPDADGWVTFLDGTNVQNACRNL